MFHVDGVLRSRSMRKLGLVVVVALIISACGKSGEVGEVDGKAVTKQEFDTYLKFKRIPAEDKKRRDVALDQYLQREALAAAIEDSKLLDPVAIQVELNEFRKELMISRYFQTYLDKQVTDEAVKAYYAKHTDEYQENRVRVAHILQRINPKMSEAERKAKLTTLQEAYSKLKTGADFAKIAKQYSEDQISAGKGGDLGWLKKGSISPRFSEVIFSTKAGEFSEPFETPFGFHIIKVLDAPMVVKRPMESVQGDIRYQLRLQAKNAEMERLRGEIKVKRFDADK